MPIARPPETRTWPDEWRPLRDDTHYRESAVDWWKRVGATLSPLDPLAYEQWMHRHWMYSPYFGLALVGLTSQRVRLPTAQLLAQVGSPTGRLGDPAPERLNDYYEHLNSPMLRGTDALDE